MVLGPIDQYKKYNIFPCNMCMHIMLVICSSIMVYFFVFTEAKVSAQSIGIFN